ncbi:aldo/keto reductase [Ruminococcus sp.]|uniref:aldo/keto reductase n=1 Tax=Ruminococcus sp. TaxID=41978 RepID=UPI003AB8C574
MILNETYTLSNGIKIPKLGLGTWFIDDDKAAEAVHRAVELGYRLIDTAQAYGNERGVGEGIRTCGVDRGELFVASKVAAELKLMTAPQSPLTKLSRKWGLIILTR